MTTSDPDVGALGTADEQPGEGFKWSPTDSLVAGVTPDRAEMASVAPVVVQVTSWSADTVRELGGDALGLSLQVATSSIDPVWVEVSFDYSKFKTLHGADWATRLGIRRWECPTYLAVQGSKVCGEPIPVDGTYNDPEQGSIRAVVNLADGGFRVGRFGMSAPGTLSGNGANLALSSEVGTFSATSLSTAGSWQVAGNLGPFSYQVKIDTPPALAGGPAPLVSLNYDSLGADAMTGAVNSQASEVGVGWSLAAGQGFIERRYRSCVDMGGISPDTCFYAQNGTIQLNGRASELIPINGTINLENSPTQFRLKDDPDWLVERVPAAIGENVRWWDGEYWKVTTPEGFTYWFGRDNEGQNSRLASPIRAFGSTYPCYAEPNHICTAMPYRWMLDRVTDPYGNDMIYKYEKWSNRGEILGTGNSAVFYDAAAILTEVDYGRAVNAGVTSFRDKVVFAYVRRCVAALSSNLDSACPTISDANGMQYPDVPTDLYCQVTPCYDTPSFFQIKRLAGIATYTSANGTSWTPVSQWRLVASFPATGDSTNEKLWLESVQRMRPDTAPVGGVGSTDFEAIRFGGTAYNNRKDGSTSAGVSFQPIYRVTKITDEFGKQTDITYKSTLYTTWSDWMSDSSDCYPQWQVIGSSSGWAVFRHWLVSTVTVSDMVMGTSGTSTPPEVWAYTYNGGAEKHYTGDEWWHAHRTYDDWRGYGEVVVTHGSGPGAQDKSIAKTKYYRGMNGEYNYLGGTNTVTLSRSWATSSEVFGVAVNDSAWLAGQAFETFQMDGTGTSYLSASRSISSWYTETPGVTVRTGVNREFRKWRMDLTYVRTRDGTATSPTWRDRRVDRSFDTLGRLVAVNDTGFLDTTGDETCNATSYINGTGSPSVGNFGWMNLVAVASSYPALGTQPTHSANNAGNCGSGVVSSESASFYSDNAHASVPNLANATSQTVGAAFKPTVTARATRLTPQMNPLNNLLSDWSVTTSTYDAAGRITSTSDPLGHATAFSFDPTFGYPNRANYPVSGLSSAVTIDPATGAPASKTDQHGNVTTYCYDAYGRVLYGYLPGQVVNCTDGSAAAARFTYESGSYFVSSNIRLYKTPTIVVSSVLQSTGVRLESAAYLDGSGRTRETQTSSPTSGKTIVSDVTILDSRGNAIATVEPFAIADATPGDRTSAAGGSNGFAAWPNLPPSATVKLTERTSVFDTANRPTSSTRIYDPMALTPSTPISLVTTTTEYQGTKTIVTPQIGSKTAAVVDAYGRTIRSDVYNGSTPPVAGSVSNGGSITSISYSWNTATGQTTSGFLTVTVRADGLTSASDGYQTVTIADLAGRVVSNTDPDSGMTTTTYDAAGNVTKVDDARSDAVAPPVWVTYDSLNRPLMRYSNTSGAGPASDAEKLAQWVYDLPITTLQTKSKLMEISAGSTASTNFTATSGSNRRLVVYAWDESGPNAGEDPLYPTSITLGGHALTQIATVTESGESASEEITVSAWYLDEADIPSGAQTLSVALNGSTHSKEPVVVSAVIYGNVNQGVAPANVTQGHSATDWTNTNVAATATGYTDRVVAFAAGGSGTPISTPPPTGSDIVEVETGHGDAAATIAHIDPPVPGATTLNFASPTQNRIASIGFSLTGVLPDRGEEISWQGGLPYAHVINGITSRLHTAADTWTIPGTFGIDALAGEWRYQYDYDEAGHPTVTRAPTMPVAPGASDPPWDVTTVRYNARGQADALTGATSSYVLATKFDDIGRVTERDLSTSLATTANTVFVRRYDYNVQTGALDVMKAGYDDTLALDGQGEFDLSKVGDDVSWFQDDRYTRDPVGNVTRIDDLGLEPSGSATDTKECFIYDQWNRLVRAHSATLATNCLSNTTAAPVASQGLLAYDTVWTYDDLTRMTSRTDRLAAAATTYSYGDSTHPHAVNSLSGATSASYSYNAIGGMSSRNGQSLSYDPQGRLTSYTGPVSQTYQYTTTNQRLLRTQGTTRVLTLPTMEVTDAAGSRTFNRYRTLGGTLVAVQTAAGIFWNCGNQQNSTTCQAPASSGSPAIPARRHYQPYGNPRGATPFATTDHGFLGQPEDATGLTYVNNRYYDPQLAVFVSVDPLVSATRSPFIYGDGSPVTRLDPSGLGTCSPRYKQYLLAAPPGGCDDTLAGTGTESDPLLVPGVNGPFEPQDTYFGSCIESGADACLHSNDGKAFNAIAEYLISIGAAGLSQDGTQLVPILDGFEFVVVQTPSPDKTKMTVAVTLTYANFDTSILPTLDSVRSILSVVQMVGGGLCVVGVVYSCGVAEAAGVALVVLDAKDALESCPGAECVSALASLGVDVATAYAGHRLDGAGYKELNRRVGPLADSVIGSVAGGQIDEHLSALTGQFVGSFEVTWFFQYSMV